MFHKKTLQMPFLMQKEKLKKKIFLEGLNHRILLQTNKRLLRKIPKLPNMVNKL
jgi:hypothetical protein